MQRLVRQQGGHTQLGKTRQHRQRGLQLGAIAVFLPNQADQLVADLIAHGIGDDHADLVVLVQKWLDPSLEKMSLQGDARYVPVRHGIHESLPAIIQFQQEIVGVEVCDQIVQVLRQRRLSGGIHVVGELAIKLIQSVPALAVAVDAIGERIDGQAGFPQRLHEVRRMIQGFVMMTKLVVPVTLAPLSDPERDIPAGDRARRDGLDQVADDFLVDQTKAVDLNQCPEIALLQILFDPKHLGTLG